MAGCTFITIFFFFFFWHSTGLHGAKPRPAAANLNQVGFRGNVKQALHLNNSWQRRLEGQLLPSNVSTKLEIKLENGQKSVRRFRYHFPRIMASRDTAKGHRGYKKYTPTPRHFTRRSFKGRGYKFS